MTLSDYNRSHVLSAATIDVPGEVDVIKALIRRVGGTAMTGVAYREIPLGTNLGPSSMARHEFTATYGDGTTRTRTFTSLQNALQIVAQRNFGTAQTPDNEDLTVAAIAFDGTGT